MTEYLFLRLTLPTQPPSEIEFRARWRLYTAAGHCLHEEASLCTLEAIASAMAKRAQAERKIVVLLPGQTALITEVRIKQQHIKHLHSAVADAVEEQLAEPLEEVHIAIQMPSVTDGVAVTQTYRVAIIQDNLMRRLTASLAAAGLSAHMITSESLLLPFSHDRATLVLDDRQILFHLSSTAVSAMELDTFLVFLNTFIQPHPESLALSTEKPAAHTIQAMEFLTDHAGMRAPTSKAFIERLETLCQTHHLAVEIKPACDNIFHWLCGQWLAHASSADFINFLQGPYRPRGKLRSLAIPWKEIAYIFIAWVCAQTIFDAAMIRYLTFKSDRFDSQSVQIYRDLFPKDNKIIDIKTQTLQHLTMSSVANTDACMAALSVLTADTELAHHLDVQSLVYDAKKAKLTANVRADDFAVFEQYKQQKAHPAWSLETNEIVREENGVHGTISIWKQQQ